MSKVDWFQGGNSHKVENVIVKNEGKTIVADLKENYGDFYTVTLDKEVDRPIYSGSYVRKRDRYSGICEGFVCFEGDQFFLFGKWSEDGNWSDWILTNIDDI